MPFYEYQCSACDHHLEVLQKISDAPLRKCPECGKQALKRLISAPVFRLKGAGWYETDFKSDSEQKRNLAGREEGESKTEEAKSESSDAKAEVKPAESKSETAKPESGDAKKVAPAKPAAKAPSKPTKTAKASKPGARKKAARR
jgi:putative FmdB family regulatory protein